MKNILRLPIIALTLLLVISCSSDDEKVAKITSAKIVVKDENGPVSNLVVYAFDETTWDVIGNDPSFANGQAATDSDGVATFANLEYPTTFNSINNNQNTFHFAVHYSTTQQSITSYIALTFTKGESKTGTINLN